jgi:pimeloyl-[acyl-carrier protein] methyl ester esterase
MIDVIIPGYSANAGIFSDFMKFNEGALILENRENTYEGAGVQLDELGAKDKLNIFGWSLGSLFALKWAAENPDTVNSIFLTGATARFTESGDYTNGIPEKMLVKMKRLLPLKKQAVMNDFYNSVLDHIKDKKKYLDVLFDNMPEIQSLSNGLNELLDIDLRGRVSLIKCPVLICHGRQDRITPLYGASYLSGVIKNSLLHVYEGGHAFFLEYPEKCSELWKELKCSMIK